MDPITRARVNTAIHQALAELLETEVKDPRVEPVTVTGVEVTNDLAHAKVYYSVLGDDEARRVAHKGLLNAARFLRRAIGQRLRLRTYPELRFEFDASLAHGERIETLLREWHEEGPAGSLAPDDDKKGTP